MLYLSNDIMLAHKSLMVNNNHNLPEIFSSFQCPALPYSTSSLHNDDSDSLKTLIFTPPHYQTLALCKAAT